MDNRVIHEYEALYDRLAFVVSVNYSGISTESDLSLNFASCLGLYCWVAIKCYLQISVYTNIATNLIKTRPLTAELFNDNLNMRTEM
jgi:hypothetical protein